MEKVKTTKKYSEIDDIRDDLKSLKNNVIELSQALKNDGIKQTKSVKHTAVDRISTIEDQGRAKYAELEGQVRENPGKSMAIAFAAGLFASMMMSRR